MSKQINIVLDTNVIFSALFKPEGSCSKVIKDILGNKNKYKLFYTPAIKEEYYAVLYRPKLTTRVSSRTITMALSAILTFGEEIMAQPISWIIYPDEADKPFVEAAIYTDSILITNNMKDYPFVGLQVSYPDVFLKE